MTRVSDVLEYLNDLAPMELKMDFDNVGLLVGDRDAKLERALIALDITEDVVDEAVQLGAQLIVSHHPVIFQPVKSILADDLLGRKLMRLIKNDISAICMHTNLDIAAGGVNDALMDALGASVSGVLEITGDGVGCGRVGELSEPVTMQSFLERCKSALNCNGLRYHDAGRPVKRLAVMGGAGGSCIDLASELGCDTYITSDVKYNGFLDAKELGLNLIDADHFCTENVIVPVLLDKMSARFGDVVFSASERHKQIAQFF